MMKKMEDLIRELDCILYYNHNEFCTSELEKFKNNSYKEDFEEGQKNKKGNTLKSFRGRYFV